MKFLLPFSTAAAAATLLVTTVNGQAHDQEDTPGGAGSATFDANFDALRAATAGSGLTDDEVKLYEEMMMGRDVNFCGCTSSDPHVYTMDGVHSECQGSGDYIYSKSTAPDTNFMVQARFSIEGTSSTWNAFTSTTSPERFFGTATKGAVVQTGFPGEPKVEVFAGTRGEQDGSNRITDDGSRLTRDKCEMQWYFDDERVIDLAGGNINTGHGIYDLGWGIFWRSGFKRYIFFRESGLWMEYEKWEYKKWGCAVNVCVCPSKKIRDQDLIGILGNADGDQNNEFMTRDGTILTGSDVPASDGTNTKIAQLNKYCHDNWCIGETGTDENIFLTPINSCDVDLDHNLDAAIEGASEELKELCLFNERCIIDAMVSGDSTVGVRTMETEEKQDEHVVVTQRNPEDGQEADVLDDVPIERFFGAKVCKQFRDYDFGWKMDRCYPNKAGPFDALTMTSLRNEAACDGTVNPGTFEIECDDKVGTTGSDFKKVTFTPSVNTAVKIRGKNAHNNNGILYFDLEAGKTYTFSDIGAGGEFIFDLEFCFRCEDLPDEPVCDQAPKECHDGSIVMRQAPSCDFRECPPCPADEKVCPDGTVLTRDFDNSCAYPECPPCDDGTFECPNGDVLSRSPDTCEFPLCGPCTDDTKTCPGGEVLTRNPADCMFPECPAVDDPMTTAAPPGTRGDPHFKTHGGEMFDFHGGCDLVLVDNPSYKNGLGLTIHIRTKIETWWSFVESAVIKIGEETLEITGQDNKEWMWLNGNANEELQNGEWNTVRFAGNNLRFKENFEVGKAHRHEAHIHLGNGEKIMFKTFDSFLKVEFINESETTLAGSRGILGTYPEGKRVGRDGVTAVEDVNAYGKEWQVTPDEPKLFHSYDAEWVVPAGSACAMPSSSLKQAALRRRRLADGIPMEAAEKACAHLSGADAKACVYDVLATQDTNMAGAW